MKLFHYQHTNQSTSSKIFIETLSNNVWVSTAINIRRCEKKNDFAVSFSTYRTYSAILTQV